MINAASRAGFRIVERPISLIYGTEVSHIRKRHNVKIILELIKGVVRTPFRLILRRI